jgi:isopentenyl diphosphate isomerase/L-lactate dehydrogenase-like FMN-dependent dehydrogenase
LARPEDALDVFDFERTARARLPPAHFGYLETGVDDDATVRANRDGFATWQIRARRLRGVRTLDTSVTLFGRKWETPIALAPIGSLKAFHPDGELAVARAARARHHLQILSTLTTTSLEEVASGLGEAPWFQLYPSDAWSVTRELVRRAEAAGCPVLVVTVDNFGRGNRETEFRAARRDSRQCSACHEPGLAGFLRRKIMYRGLDLTGATNHTPDAIDWDDVKRLKDTTRLPLVLKGIMTAEDAALSLEHGVDGLIVSNHGGRAEESVQATIDALPAIADTVRDRIPILVDSGFRRGTDIFKALALGARAVCIGRPYVWGLASFGEAGVAMVLDILGRELQVIMRQAGTGSIAAIDKNAVARAR